MESLAVKYRPKTFSDVCSQESTVKILEKMVEIKRYNNSYLFCGASGCGKTTVARIFADQINNHVGAPIEIDGASNNGVDNVKEIIQSASERAVDAEYKVYIIDECHALTPQAWQAFLKCIEEPPHYTIFIFCTTDPQKIPATIQNRVMRFNFNRIPVPLIQERLLSICEQEHFLNYVEACDYIVKTCNGGMRDAIALLEKCARYDRNITVENVLKCTDDIDYKILFEMVNSIIDGNEKNILDIIDKLFMRGTDLKIFTDQFLTFCIEVLKYILFNDISAVKIPQTLFEDLKYCCNFDNASKYYTFIINKLLELKNMLKIDNSAKSTVEVMLLSIARGEQ